MSVILYLKFCKLIFCLIHPFIYLEINVYICFNQLLCYLLYMAQVFLDNLNPVHNYPIHACNTYIKNDISLIQTILHSGDRVIYDTDLDVQNTDQKHKCTWKALYKVHSQIKNS